MSTTRVPSYDYVVCGGGSSGCVVAARLSEDKFNNVLLLEAGISDHDFPETSNPSIGDSIQGSDLLDWNYKCEPQPYAYKGFRDVNWSKGKILGGGSTINNMGFTRCAAADYDSWEELGCTGWGWKDVKPYFLKTENWRCPKFVESVEHRVGGPITITRPGMSLPVAKAFIKAGCELGYKEIDACSGDVLGFGYFPTNINIDGKRASSSRAFIHPAEDRQNLTVLCQAHVTKIDIKGNRAVGVYFVKNGETRYVSVKKEVIVSGGPINSPQLLMLSGIGPKAHLEEFGIECIKDLPVGQNLQDHISIFVKVSVKPGSGVWSSLTQPKKSNSAPAIGFVQTKHEKNSQLPDVQYTLVGRYYPFGPDEPSVHRLVSKKFYPHLGYNTTREERLTKEGFTFHAVVMHPKSVGEIRLRSTNPFVHPIIDPHYLEHPYDVKVLAEAIRIAKKIVDSDAMKSFECEFFDLKMPGSPYDAWSDENLEEYIRHFAFTTYHPVGTCKMGSPEDPSTVVDPQLRVRGIKGLRVVDSSVMPNEPTGNTNAPSIMIGEKGADIIKAAASTTKYHRIAAKL